jgi:hypothetical protein
MPALPALAELGEGSEHGGLGLGRYAAAAVAGPETDHATALGIGAEFHTGGRSAVLEGVADVVGPDLLDPRSVPDGSGPGFWEDQVAYSLI